MALASTRVRKNAKLRLSLLPKPTRHRPPPLPDPSPLLVWLLAVGDGGVGGLVVQPILLQTTLLLLPILRTIKIV